VSADSISNTEERNGGRTALKLHDIGVRLVETTGRINGSH